MDKSSRKRTIVVSDGHAVDRKRRQSKRDRIPFSVPDGQFGELKRLDLSDMICKSVWLKESTVKALNKALAGLHPAIERNPNSPTGWATTLVEKDETKGGESF